MPEKQQKQAELRENIFEAYMEKSSKSKQIYDKSCDIFAGGVSGNAKFFQPYPIYMAYGEGSKTYDVDGNEYIDCFLCSGPLILGHNHPELAEGIKRELDKGLLMYNPALAVECAALVKELIPCAERVRFANSGTEATMFAARFARAYTGKNKIIKFYGHYHGQDDQFLIATANDKDEPMSLGVPKDSLSNTVVLKYKDISVVRQKLDEDKDIAAVILDPQMNMGGIWPPTKEYLQELRQLTRERGVILIFDEVITGFRLAPGGAQEYFGVTPDLTSLSKAIAGGEKLAAVAGKADIMSVAIPKGLSYFGAKEKTVFQSGTYNDCTVAIAAGIASMKLYKQMKEKGEYERFHHKGERLQLAIEAAFKERGMRCHVNRLGPSLKIFLTDLEPSFEAYCKLDKTNLFLFLLSLVNEGVILSWPSSGSVFLSFAHTDEDIQTIIKAVNTSLDKYNWKEVL